MDVYVAGAKYRTDRYAGAMIYHLDDLNLWHATIYGHVRGRIGPVSSQPCQTLEEAFQEANSFLKTIDGDWQQMTDEDAEQYLLSYVAQNGF